MNTGQVIGTVLLTFWVGGLSLWVFTLHDRVRKLEWKSYYGGNK